MSWQFCAGAEQNVEGNGDSEGHPDAVSDEQNSLLGTVKRLPLLVLYH